MVNNEWSAANHTYGLKDITFERFLRRNPGERHKFSVGWHNFEVSCILTLRSDEGFVSIPQCRVYYKAVCLAVCSVSACSCLSDCYIKILLR